MVLDVGCCGFWHYKQYYGCGCGSVLSARVADCAVEFLLVLDVTDYDVCSVGGCEALGQLAGETDD